MFRLFVWLLLASVTVNLIPVGSARTAAAVDAEDAPIDLAAVVPSPSDLEQAGFPGFAIANVAGDTSGWETIGDAVEDSVAMADIVTESSFDQLNFELDQAGWRRQYRRVFGLPDEFTGSTSDVVIFTQVAEFEDEEGADAALSLLLDGGEIVKLDYPVGDWLEARMTHVDVELYPRLTVAFRDKNVLGFVTITQYIPENEIDLNAANFLAKIFQERIDAGSEHPGPNLAGAALRLGALSSPGEMEGYVRLNGETPPIFGETPEDLASRSDAYANSSDVYQLEQYLLPRSGQTVGPLLVDRIYRFPDAESAGKLLASMPQALARDSANSNGSFEAALVEDASFIGDESLTFQIRDTRWDTTTYGYRVYTRVGATVARIQLDGGDSPTIQSVEELAMDQAECLAVGSCAAASQFPQPPSGIGCPPTNQMNFSDAYAAPLNEGTAPMFGVDPARSGVQPGPRPAGNLQEDWELSLNGALSEGVAMDDGRFAIQATGSVYSHQQDESMNAGYLYVFDSAGVYQWCMPIGDVKSDPVLSDGLVFTEARAHEGNHFQSSLAALDVETGELQWTTSVGPAFSTQTGSILAADGAIYASTGLGTLYAFDQKTGETRWIFEVGPNSGIPLEEQDLNRPAYSDGQVFITAGHTIQALDAESGKVLWQFFTDDEAERLGDPTVANGIVYAGGTQAIYAIEAASGKQLWQSTVDTEGASELSVDDDHVYVSTSPTSEETTVAFLAALDAKTGKLIWQTELAGYVTKAAIAGNVLYVGTEAAKAEAVETGELAALDANTGQLRSSYPLYGTITAPVVVGGQIFISGTSTVGTGPAGSIYVFSGSEAPVEV